VRFPWRFFMVWGLLVVPLGVQAQSAGESDPAGAGLPLFRPLNAVAVMAQATEVWRAVPTDPHDLLGTYQFLPPHATADTEGQVFHLLEAEPGFEISDSEGRFVAVPWTVGCGCVDEGWDEPNWVPPGDTVVFLLTSTRERVPWDGPPVFDVLGWHQPYPVGEFIPYWRHTRAEPPSWLTRREFFELLQSLPSETAFRLDPTSSLQAVVGWLRENPGREDAFPVPTILWELERITGGTSPALGPGREEEEERRDADSVDRPDGHEMEDGPRKS
jgi:hypothetical protein